MTAFFSTMNRGVVRKNHAAPIAGGTGGTSAARNVYQTSCDTRRRDQWSIYHESNTSYPRSHLSPGRYKLTRRATTRARCPPRDFYIFASITMLGVFRSFLTRECDSGATNSWLNIEKNFAAAMSGMICEFK